MKKLGLLAAVLAVCVLFGACEAQGLGTVQALPEQSTAEESVKTARAVSGTGSNDSQTGNTEAAKAKSVLQSYLMQTAGSSGTTADAQAFLTLYSDDTFSFKIQMYDGYPTVDGVYQSTDAGYLLVPQTTTAQNIPVSELGEITMQKEGDNLVYEGSQLNDILSGAVFVPCILSDEG